MSKSFLYFVNDPNRVSVSFYYNFKDKKVFAVLSGKWGNIVSGNVPAR
jgi:hypothetical protein